MAASNLSRTATTLVVGLSLVLVALAVGRCCGKSGLEAAGLDWWNVPALLQDQARSQDGVERAERLRADIAAMALARDEMLSEVLTGERSVAEGLTVLRELHAETPVLQHTLRKFYPHLGTDEAIKVYYRRMLREMIVENPQMLVRESPELTELLAAESRCS